MKSLRRTFYDLRTEGQGRVREACAIAAGLFIGCMPFYGVHLLLCWVVGRLFRLNRLKLYLAANVSNPVVAPLLVFVELQTVHGFARAHFLALTLETARTITPWQCGAHLCWQVALAASSDHRGLATYLAWGRFTRSHVRQTGERGRRPVPIASITAWEFARGSCAATGVSRRTARWLAPVSRAVTRHRMRTGFNACAPC